MPTTAARNTFFGLDNHYYQAGTHDPSAVATDGLAGALFVQSAVYPATAPTAVWRKLDNGVTTNWVPFGNGGLSPMDIAQTVLVAKNGNDATADGTWNQPYLTIGAAIASITDATTAKRYAIILGPGSYAENVVLPANISIKSLGGFRNTIINGTLDVDNASWAAAPNGRAVIQDLIITGNVTVDFLTAPVVDGSIAWISCHFGGNYTFHAPSVVPPAPGSFVTSGQLYLCLFFGTNPVIEIMGGRSAFTATHLNLGSGSGALNILSSPGDDGTQASILSCAIRGDVSVIGTGADKASLEIGGNFIANHTTLTLDGSGVYVAATVDSIPEPANLSVLNGANLDRMNSANGLSYFPTVPTDWALVPSEVDAALDELAAKNSTPIQQIVFVAKNGDDATATGSLSRPFLTVSAALASITDNADNKKYLIAIAPGVYVEAVLNIKPNISIAAFSVSAEASSIVHIAAASYTLDAGWAAGTVDTRTVFSGIVFDTGGLIDNTAVLGIGVIMFKQSTFNGAMQFTDPACTMAVIGENALFNGATDFVGFQLITGSFQFQAATTYTSAVGGASTFAIQKGLVLNSLTVTVNAGETASFFLVNSPVVEAFGGSLSLIGTGGTLNAGATVDSLPSEAGLTVANATLNRISNAFALAYVPAVPADWAVPPTYVSEALDMLAAAGGGGGTTPERDTRALTAPEIAAGVILPFTAIHNTVAANLKGAGLLIEGVGEDYTLDDALNPGFTTIVFDPTLIPLLSVGQILQTQFSH